MLTKKIIILTVVLFSGIVAMSLVSPLYAKKTLADAPSALSNVGAPTGLTKQDLRVTVGEVIASALRIIGLLFFVLMVYAGIRWMTARGEDDAITKARDTIIAATIGLIIVVSAYALTNLVTKRIILQESGSSFDPSNPNVQGDSPLICCITPIIDQGTTGAWLGTTIVVGQTESLRTAGQCLEMAQGTERGDGKDWEMYPSVNDAGTCSKIQYCWEKAGAGSETKCILDLFGLGSN